MTFVNPLLLCGGLLIAVPIVLHLIMRRKPRLLEFPALRFIQKRHDVNRRRLLLRHLLLLLLRVAAIALLAFALARPSVNFSGVFGSQEAPVAAVLVFDAAPRMEYRHANRSRLEAAREPGQPRADVGADVAAGQAESRLEAARELGQWILAQLPGRSQIAVLDTRPRPGEFVVDRGAARQRIERLAAVNNSRPLTDVVQEAIRLAERSELPRKEIYVFTDLSRAAWPADAAASLRERMAELPNAGIYVIDVGVDEPSNYALGELHLSGQVLSNRSPLVVETRLSRSGAPQSDPPEERTVELYLLDNERKEQKRSGQSSVIRPGQSQRLEFGVGSLGIGTHQGVVRIVGQDPLAADDVRYFTVEVRPAWKILIAAAKPAEETALYLSEALAPDYFRRTGQARFECQVIDVESLSDHDLEPYAVVCLVDPVPLAPADWKKLGDYVSEGHGLAIFLGRNARLESFNAPVAQELLPGKLLRQVRVGEQGVYLSPRDYQHLLLAEFRGLAESIPWQAFPVYRYWRLEKPAAGVGVVIPYSDGRPALLERSLGQGRAITMTTPVSDNPNRDPWNLLPVGEAWPFGILSHQVMRYLVGSGDQRLNYYAGRTARLQLGPEDRYTRYLLRTPGELNFRIDADLKQRLLRVDSTEQVGNYRVEAGGQSGVDRGFSVNLDPQQTELERISRDELSEVFGQADYRLARTRDQIERDQQRGRVGRELFTMLILAVVAVLATEHVVANRFYKE